MAKVADRRYNPIMAAFDHGARLCPAKWDQPQQLRKTSLLEYA